VRPLAHSVLYPHDIVFRAYTYIYFGENQISLSLISLLLLSTNHPKPFQRSRVRSSTTCYCRFNLLMDRSLSFGSTAYNCVALFTLGFPAPPGRRPLSLLQTVSRWIIMQKARRQPVLRHRPTTACKCPVSGSFSHPARGSFQCSLALLVHYRSIRSI
jgi:hypothetical protein